MSWRTGFLLPVLTLALVALLPEPQAAGQTGKEPTRLDPPAIDRLVDTTLREVLIRGVPIYNSGEFDSAYRLYEGALMAIKPLLAHRADLQKEIDGALIVADRTTELSKRAWVLREAMDKIRTTVKKEAVPMNPVVVEGSVTGLVSVDTVPLASGKINLFGPENRIYFAPIVQGKYSLPRVAFGEYKVVLTEDPASKIKVEPKYLDVALTPLTLKVIDSSPAVFNFGVKALAMKMALGTVQGKITVDDKPYPGARIVLSAAGAGTKLTVADRDGTFSFKELKPAEYKVILGEDLNGPKLDEKFLDPATTPLRVKVEADKPANLDIALQGQKKPVPVKPIGPKPEQLKVAPTEVKKSA